MSCDISRDGDYIATASYDRTWKLWGPSILGDLGL
jgi:WD40 repeat protein